MEIAQPGDIAYGIFAWLLGGKHHVSALSGAAPLSPENVAAIISEEWLFESETFAIWCYCLLLARRIDHVSDQRLQALRSALQVPDDFTDFADKYLENDPMGLPDLVGNPSPAITSGVTAAVRACEKITVTTNFFYSV